MQERQKLTTNPLTYAEGVTFDLPDIYIEMGLVERKKQPKHNHNQNISPEQGSGLYQETEITQKYEHNEFLTQVFHNKDTKKSQGKRIAIIGEPGAGKTTLLQKIASYLSQENSKSIIIWVSLAELENGKLRDYLDKTWLRNASERSGISESKEEIKNDFIAQFNQDKVWLLLDGLDEMSTNSGNILTDIAQQIREGGYINQARIVLTCRLNLWDGSNNQLADFDTYRTLDFSYPEQVEQFINKWFTSQQKAEAGRKLCNTLKEAGRERIQDLVKNPLRLTLLCLNWQQREAKLPDTQAEFYQQLVDNFNGWKQDEFAQISETQREELITDLGKLARKAIDQATSRFRLLDGCVKNNKFLDDDKLKLALKLGWLNRIGIGIDGKPVYAFFHTSFQEYFAATAINDWDFFLPKTHNNKPIEAQKYRIFEPQWKQTILLWLGREDVDKSEKESFIQALINFQDGCVKYQGKGFYGYRAYFLAAGGIAEFKHCSQADQIVKQIINWKFDNSVSNIHDQADVALQETDRQKAIAALVELINTSQDESTRRWAAESLGEIDVGNAEAIAALVELIKTSKDEDTRSLAAQSLGKIGVGNAEAIAALVELINTSEYEYTRSFAADSLGKIGLGNAVEIAALVELINRSQDLFTKRMVAEGLEKICIGNQVAIAALVELINTSEDEYTRWWAAESLGKIDPGNAEAIAALVKLINTSKDEDTRRRAAESLGKIGVGNAEAIAVLVELIKTSKGEYKIGRAHV